MTYANASEQSPKKHTEQPLNRACEACRLSKVRCLVNPGSGSSQCQRCAKAGRQCVFAPPAKRRQRKRTDVRVAELEREVRQLTSLLKPNATVSPVQASDHESADEDDTMETEEQEPPSYPQRHGSTNTPSAPQPLYPRLDPWANDPIRPEWSDKDIIDRGIITMGT